jgi:integrase/recombinase XerD
VPALFADAGSDAARRPIEFFTANIRNRHTRAAYARAVARFARWSDARHVALAQLTPVIVAAYIEELGQHEAKPTVEQLLAALRMLFDYLVTGHVMPTNPAYAVRGPKHVVKTGRTPVLSAEETRILLDSVDVNTIAGLRDRALIGVMVYSFARVGAVVGMKVEDYYQEGKRWWFRLYEKGGTPAPANAGGGAGERHEVPAHHNAEAYVDAYLAAAQIAADRKGPLFRSLDRERHLTARRLRRLEVLATPAPTCGVRTLAPALAARVSAGGCGVIKRRARHAGLPLTTCCHTFRATGITTYLQNGGTLEHAQQIANHESPRTTKLYDRTDDAISLDERACPAFPGIERNLIFGVGLCVGAFCRWAFVICCLERMTYEVLACSVFWTPNTDPCMPLYVGKQEGIIYPYEARRKGNDPLFVPTGGLGGMDSA